MSIECARSTLAWNGVLSGAFRPRARRSKVVTCSRITWKYALPNSRMLEAWSSNPNVDRACTTVGVPVACEEKGVTAVHILVSFFCVKPISISRRR